MHIKKIMTKAAATVLFAALAGLFTTAQYYSERLPDVLTAETASEVRIAEYPEISLCSGNSDSFFASPPEQATLSLFGAIPVKNVRLKQSEAPTLIVGGKPFGIKLLMEGVMVTGLGDVEADSGEPVCPAAEAGIETGDIVRSANGNVLTSNLQLQALITGSGGSPIRLSVQREDSRFETVLKPVFSEKSKQWKGGMWVRDSIAGIGTMTFIDKATGRFAGLGHPICDSDTGGIVPLHSGEAVPIEIADAKRGEKGIPGELRGQFSAGSSFGTLDTNTDCGIFGKLNEETFAEISAESVEYKLGYRQDITTGEAEVWTTVDGDTPQKYAINIEKIDYTAEDSTRNMLIRITDERLIEASGGIIQGMSGSPIIQNDKLIGAVTHVFVTDPTCGYAIFAENMAECINK